MKILNNPVFWREKTQTINSGMTSFTIVLAQLAILCSTMWMFSQLIKDFLLTFSISWFFIATFAQFGAFGMDDIEAIAATPLGIKDFANGRTLFSLCQTFLCVILVIPFFYYNKLDQAFSLNPLGIAVFLAGPFFIYYGALFLNTISFFIPARLMKILPLILIAPIMYAPLCALLLKEPARSIVMQLIIPTFGILAFIANTLLYKFMPKEAIRSQVLND